MPKRGKKAPPAEDPRPMEGIMRDLQALLREREFDSEEELNAFLQQHVVGKRIPTAAPESPLDRATELIYQAWTCEDEAQRLALAREALKISPDAADAWVLLAEMAEHPHEARALYVDAVAAAERALGGDLATRAPEGELWMAIEARPYLRARFGLAVATWTIGDRPAAIDQAWELLRLNSNDNQGVRYVLLDWLLRAGSLEEIERLLARFESEDAAAWQFPVALHRFRTEGPSRRARAALRAAIRSNRHVVRYLLDERQLPDLLPAMISPGGEDEAVAYAAEGMSLWFDTPGAIEWLSKTGASR